MREEVAQAPVYVARRAARLRRTQREVLLEELRLARRSDSWLTLEEMAGKTKFPPASISAQLRHLRKLKYGGWIVQRRKRSWARDGGTVWEYRLGGKGGRRGKGGKGRLPRVENAKAASGLPHSKGGGDERTAGDGV